MPTPPEGLWSGLNSQLPVALVPIRLETSYGTRQATGGDGAAPTVTLPVLRVRIYPDELSVVTSSPGLNAVEKDAGAQFWTAQAAPETADEAALPGAFEHRRRAAWEVLARQVGQPRTAFVATSTRPGQPAAPDRVEQAATARLLPDSWVISGYLDGTQVFAEHVVRPDADLQVGPSRDAGRDAFDPSNPRLVHADDGLRWMTDFEAAVTAGMAAVIDLANADQVRAGQTPPAVTRGLDTLVVVGVRDPVGARTVDTEAGLFAELLTAHAANDRVAFLAQGTPTNNLTDQPSGWSTTTDVFAGYDQVITPPVAAAAPSTVSALRGGTADGTAFETALGLPAGLTAGFDGAARQEQWLARNMALTLFPATIGEVIGTLCRPGSLTGIVNQATVDRYLDQLDTVMPFVREHVAAFVRGRGPLPALRIGRQPYGVLPILPASRWVRGHAEPEHLDRLSQILGLSRTFFEPATARIPALRPGVDATTELVRILGLAPVPHSGGYTVRDVTGRLSSIFITMNEPTPVAVNAGAGVTEAVRAIAASGSMNTEISIPAYRHLLALTVGDLVHGTELEWLALNGVKPMRAPVAQSDKNNVGWETPPTYLGRLIHELFEFRLTALGAGERRPRDLLFLLAEHSLALAGELDTLRILSVVNAGLFSSTVGISAEVSESALSVAKPYAALFASTAAELAGPAAELPHETIATLVSDEVKRSDLIAKLNLTPEHVNGFAGTRDAVLALANAALSDDEYARLTSETLACAGTRLDAWFTSLAAQRLEQLRAAQPSGLQLGAWGLLVDVRPQPGKVVAAADVPTGWAASPGAGVTADLLVHPPRQVGYVHAPSLAQARTAGVLRAGELAHAGDGSSLAALDLTSRRVRIAREIIDSMADGQPLGALLGYRLERLLGDRGLHAEVAALRQAFPQRRVGGAAGDVAAGADAVVPQEVVDGFEVWQCQPQAKQVCQAFGHLAELQQVLDELGQAVEAVADLIVAEGVHQITAGRPESGGATFTALADGTSLPELDVVREPRSGLTITHRTVVVLDPAAGTAGWNRTAPRAVLAPHAERWAEQVLGAAGDWRITVGAAPIALDTLQVCALDVLAEARSGAAPRPPFEDRLLAAQDDPAAVIADPAYARLLALAQAAGAVLAAARPATKADLTPPVTAAAADAVQVLATAPPNALLLQPIADTISAQLDALVAGIAAIVAASTGQNPAALVPAALLTPFRDLGLPGSIRTGAQITLGDVVAAASAAATVLRDVDQLLDQGLHTPLADTSRPGRLTAVCATPTGTDTLVKIVRRLGGPAVVPAVSVDSSLGDCSVAGVDADAVERWVARMGRVRTDLAAFDDLRLFVEAAGQELEPLQAFQLPLVADEGWLGDALPADPGGNELRAWKRPDGPRTHLVATGKPDLIVGATVCALVIDEVSEVLPAPTVSSGLAIHYDAPTARPPQSILLAVHPDPTQAWSWSLLDEVVREALALAKLRGVELDDLAGTGIDEYLPLTYVRDGLDRTTPMSELTRGFELLLEAVAANRFLERQP